MIPDALRASPRGEPETLLLPVDPDQRGGV